MASECADSGAGAGVASCVGDFAAKERAQSRFDESPGSHVLRFFLTPDELRVLWKWLKHFAQPFFCEWIKLLDANNRRIVDFALGAILQQIVVDFARAKDDPLHFIGMTGLWRAQDLFEPAMNE